MYAVVRCKTNIDKAFNKSVIEWTHYEFSYLAIENK